jgi:hypothetical protein
MPVERMRGRPVALFFRMSAWSVSDADATL